MNPNLSTSYRAFQLVHERRVSHLHRALHAGQPAARHTARSAMAAGRLWVGSMLMGIGMRVLGVPGGVRIHDVSSSRT